jgi:serine/threonine-protein kinase
MSLTAGTRIGVYEVAGVLGRGGMGEVYRARDTRLDRTVALKILPAELSRDSERLSRFEREARLASSLNHANIVVIYDIGIDDNVNYIAMEFVEGETLYDLLRKGVPAVGVTADLAYQIADALSRAHAAGIIHRDLKPSNIMVTPERRVKVLDFGLGKLIRGDGSESNALTEMRGGKTTPGVLLGTAAYMSPEQAVGNVADARSDQFAFGLMLYELLSGTHPFIRGSSVQTMSAIIEDEAEPLAIKAPKTPEALGLIVERCLAKAPADRFDSTTDLARALQNICDHLRSGRTLAPIARPVTHRRGRRWAWAAAVAIGLTVAGAGVWRQTMPSTTTLPGSRQVALLPFANVGGDPTNQALADGLAEVLTTRLTQLERFTGGLQVVPAVEVRQQRVQSATEARRAFGVNLVVSGSLQRSTDRLLLTLNVIDGATLRQVRADAIELESFAPAALQDEVLVRLARLLDIELDARAQTVLAAGGTRAPGAYEYYLQGRGYLQRFERAGSVDSALELFQRALKQDPDYALAHAAIAEACWRKYEATKDTTWVTRARESGATALRLSPSLSEVQVTLAIIANGTGEYENAVTTLSSVLERDPTDADAYRELGRAYDALGDSAKAEATLARAVTARPGDWAAYNSLGSFYFRHQRLDAAAAQFERVVALTPDNARGYSNLGSVYAQQRQWEKAFPALEAATKLGPTGSRWSNLATAYFRRQRFSDAAVAYEHATELDPKNHQVWFNLASAYLWTPGSEAKATPAFARAASLGEEARAVNARDPALFARLANCYAHLNQPDKARAAAADAEKAGKTNGAALLLLAQAYERIGDRATAITKVKAALAAGLAREEVESTRSLEALRTDPAYAALR